VPHRYQVRESYDEVRDIYMQLRQRGRLATCVVVANKIDLTEQRDVTYQEGLEMVWTAANLVINS